MARSIRSKRGKALRRIQREKITHWDNNRILKLSNALANSEEHVTYQDEDGSEGILNNETQQKVAEVLAEKASSMEVSDQAAEESEEPKKERTLNQIIKGTGLPKRKKRVTARYGKKKKKRA